MTNVSHAGLTGDDLHEPKGVAEASANTVYRADGAGSGSWEAPLKLIERRALTTNTAEDFTGLSTYRHLIFIIESISFGTPTTEAILLQVGTSSAWRTSGYYTSAINDLLDTANLSTAGLLVGRGSSIYGHGFGVIEISNFNTTYPTSSLSYFNTNNVNRINSSSSGAPYPGNYMSIYPTAEAHEKLRLTTPSGDTMTDGYLTLYGM